MALRGAANTTHRGNETTESDSHVTTPNIVIPPFLTYELPIVVFVLGTLCNIILLYYLIASKKYKRPLFTLITSLAMADLCACIAGFGFVVFLIPSVTFPSAALFLCKVFQYMSGVGVTCSTHHLALFAALRFYQLCYPLKSHARLTFTFMLTCCSGLWLVVLSAWIPWAYHVVSMTGPSGMALCGFTGDIRAAQYGFLVCNTIYPAVAIPLLYIVKHIRVLQASMSVDVQRERKRTDVKALAIVVIVFFLTWLPNNIFSFIVRNPGGEIAEHYSGILIICSYLMHSNSALNPLIYCLAAETVRKDLIRFLFRRK